MHQLQICSVVCCIITQCVILYNSRHTLCCSFQVAIFEGHKSDIHFLLSFGSHLISVDEQSTVRVWIVQTTGTCTVIIVVQRLKCTLTYTQDPPPNPPSFLFSLRQQKKIQLWPVCKFCKPKDRHWLSRFKVFVSFCTLVSLEKEV